MNLLRFKKQNLNDNLLIKCYEDQKKVLNHYVRYQEKKQHRSVVSN